jgi:hypothetical protein
MKTPCQENKQHDVIDQRNTWDFLIEEATRQLQEYEARSSKLRVCISYFGERKSSGDDFPGAERLREKGLLPD